MTTASCAAYRAASVPRRAVAVTLDAAVLVTSGLLIVRRRLTNAAAIHRLAVPVAIQAGYFTVTTAVAGGSPGLREQQDRLAEEFSHDPDQLDERLPALHSGRRMAALWAPPALTVTLLVVYKLTLGRGAHDRLSNTRVVATVRDRQAPT